MVVQAIRHIVRRWPFTLLGVLSTLLFILAAEGLLRLGGGFRVIISPVYAMRLLIVAVQVSVLGSSPIPLLDIATTPLLLTPYALLDAVVHRAFRKRQALR